MVDRTVYTDLDHTPELPLRQLFARQKLPEALCKLLADTKFLSLERVAMLGESVGECKLSITAMFKPDELGGSDPERLVHTLFIAAVWQAARTLQVHMAGRRARMEEDPHKIPELPQDDHSEFRQRFVKSHPDTILTVWKEPHKKFVERIHRDYAVHSSVPFYHVGEIRTRVETITQRSGMAKSADDLIKLAKEDEPAQVATSEEVMDRLFALFVALEYTNICPFTVLAGTVRYIKELEKFRHDHPGMTALVRADRLLRGKAAEINQDDRDNFPSFSEALIEVMNNHRYLWNEARTIEKRDRADSPEKGDRPAKKPRVDLPAGDKVSKSARRNKKLREALATVKAGQQLKHSAPVLANAAAAKAQKGSGKGAARGTDQRVPKAEWAEVCAVRGPGKPKCRYFNTSLGCKFGAECKQEHKCSKCGGDHPWHSHCR